MNENDSIIDGEEFLNTEAENDRLFGVSNQYKEESEVTPAELAARIAALNAGISDADRLGHGTSKIGVTRKDKSETKKARKQARKSRRINQKRANKKSRRTGSLQRR